MKFFEENKNCPTCTQDIKEEFRQDKIDEERRAVVKLQDGYKQLLSEITKQEEKISNFDKVSERIRNIETNVAKLNTSIDELKRYSDRLEDEIEKLRIEDTSEPKYKRRDCKTKTRTCQNKRR